MNRYIRICSIPSGTLIPLKDTAVMLVEFIAEAEDEGMNPMICPAVMLLGQQLGLQLCRPDMHPQQLFDRCMHEVNAREVARQYAN